MPEIQGKFQYIGPDAAVKQEGECRVQFDPQTLTLTPAKGAALAFDLGDLDEVVSGEYEIRLALYTGRRLALRQLGRAYETFAHDLIDAYRNRTVQCLLLEDMEEVGRFPANVASSGIISVSGPAEIRLYKTNLAVLPTAGAAFQWRLADIDDVSFESNTFEVTVQSGSDRLKVSRLAKRTEEFVDKLREAMNALATQTAQALHTMLPFLDPDQLQSCAGELREGRSAALAKLAAIHKQIPAALAANAVDANLKPYYDALIARSVSGLGYAGFKLIRHEDAEAEADAHDAPDQEASITESAAADADASGPETLYWFLFPLASQAGGTTPANVVAWEASSRSGRATYFFRLVDPAEKTEPADSTRAASLVDSSIRRLSRVLALLNFRRRPIYLSDDELMTDPRFHRYAISARRLPEVREVRASFLGRALHTSPEAWQTQVDAILAKV